MNFADFSISATQIASSMGLLFFAYFVFVIFMLFYKAAKLKKTLQEFCNQMGYGFYFDARGFKVSGRFENFDFEFGNWYRATTHRSKERRIDFFISGLKLEGERLQISEPMASKGIIASLAKALNDKRVFLNCGEENIFSVFCNDEALAKRVVTSEIVHLYQKWFNQFPLKKYGRFNRFPSLRWSNEGLEILYFQVRQVKVEELRLFLDFCFELSSYFNKANQPLAI